MADLRQELQIAIQHHQAGRTGQARALYEQILSRHPEQPDALNLLAVLAQQTGNPDEASRLFERSIAANPGNPSAYINRGNLQRMQGDLPGAEVSYRRALELRPHNADAHNNLGTLLQLQGKHKEATAAYRRALELRPDYAEAHYNLGVLLQETEQLDAAVDAYRQALHVSPGHAPALNNLGTALQLQGKFDEAETAYRQAIELRSDYPDAWFNLGNLHQERGELNAAVSDYERATVLKPDFADAHRNLGSTLCRMGRLDEAERRERHAIELEPDRPEGWNNLGITLKDKGDSAAAEDAFRKALDFDPAYAHARGNLASLLEVLNRLDDAAEEVRAGLKTEPDDALLNLIGAKLKRRAGEVEAALDQLRHVDVEALPPERAGQLHHELGMLHDRLDRPADAIAALEKANAVLARETRFMGIDKQRYLDKLERLEKDFTQEWAATWVKNVKPGTDKPPVFLVGFPRSGTTLLEVALDAHPALLTLEELPTVVRVGQQMQELAGPIPQALANVTEEQIEQLRESYFALVDSHAPERGDATIIDKMPLSIADAGLLWRLFPNAKFILALRHPADVVLSCFMQSFQPNVAMANLNTLEGAADLYNRVMRLWQCYTEILPLDYHTVRYEDVVEDFEEQVRRLIGFLGLPWDDAVLAYRKSAARRTRINTPSYHQVTEPIYKRSRFRWERYRTQLNPVMDTLRPWIRAWGY